jgi:hypothetical protein
MAPACVRRQSTSTQEEISTQREPKNSRQTRVSQANSPLTANDLCLLSFILELLSGSSGRFDFYQLHVCHLRSCSVCPRGVILLEKPSQVLIAFSWSKHTFTDSLTSLEVPFGLQSGTVARYCVFPESADLALCSCQSMKPNSSISKRNRLGTTGDIVSEEPDSCRETLYELQGQVSHVLMRLRKNCDRLSELLGLSRSRARHGRSIGQEARKCAMSGWQSRDVVDFNIDLCYADVICGRCGNPANALSPKRGVSSRRYSSFGTVTFVVITQNRQFTWWSSL